MGACAIIGDTDPRYLKIRSVHNIDILFFYVGPHSIQYSILSTNTIY